VLIWPVTTVFLVAAALNIQKNQIGIDHLTGISNRLLFDEMLNHHLHLQQGFGCILMDLDGFKQINDTLGHDAGDQALQEMARILRRVAGPKDIVARYGGDEFVILMHEASEYHLQDLVSRIELEVAMSNQSSKRPYLLSVSMDTPSSTPHCFPMTRISWPASTGPCMNRSGASLATGSERTVMLAGNIVLYGL
jgi:diguanylate cyclase (GGDEF)-like protein